MSDHDHEPELHESPLEPGQDARIRALLADARHTEPMPADVVARLDRVLDGLASERAPVAPVIDLARRRRTAAKLLVAAAAVIVAGVGVSQVLPGVGSDNGSADQATAGDAPEAAQADGSGGGSDRAPQLSDSVVPQPVYGDAARIRPDHFGADVRRVRSRIDGGDAKSYSAVPDTACLPAPVGEGTVIAATYDGAPAALVLRPPAGDTQVVDLYLCGQTAPLRSITLTAR
jgi:hypothetical protein